LFLKDWNKAIDSDKNKRLNSFSIYMLLLTFMIHEGYLVNLLNPKPQIEKEIGKVESKVK